MPLICAILCAQYLGQVVAAAAPNTASHNRFTIAPAEAGVGDAQHAAYAADLTRAMAAQGFEPAATPEEANLTVRLSYAVSGPLKRSVADDGGAEGPGGARRATAARSMITSGGGGFGEDDEGSGPEPTARTVTYYTRTVTVAAYVQDPAAAAGPPRMLWQTRVRSDGDKPAMAQAVPAMIAMAGPYLARSTGKIVDARIDDRDAELKRVRGEGK